MAKSAERLPGTSTRLRTRDDGCCSVNFLKYVLHIYNVVLFVSDVKPRGLMHYTRVTSSEIAKWRGVSALTDDCFTFPLAIGRVLSNVMSFRSRKPPPPPFNCYCHSLATPPVDIDETERNRQPIVHFRKIARREKIGPYRLRYTVNSEPELHRGRELRAKWFDLKLFCDSQFLN